MNANWMGWTLPTALFFLAIALILTAMGFMAKLAPRNAPRVGLLGIATQRGDRLCSAPLGLARFWTLDPGLTAWAFL